MLAIIAQIASLSFKGMVSLVCSCTIISSMRTAWGGFMGRRSTPP